ncbi:MAG: isoprenylcysteine carboxylmethyltransferase family protein [Hydrogenovibrio sp.]|nr:isoprenylcysteine carboxylmethyltransferase family protein [Hydrogenovibrio sp.]
MPTKPIHPILSYGLVTIQFAAIGWLFTFEPWLSTKPAGLAIQLLGVFLGISAVAVMHLGRFNIIPDPRIDAKLVTKGPYRWIRHPMYTSLLLFFLPILLQTQSISSWLAFLILIVDLLIKLHYEEKLLVQRFAEYRDYQNKTAKILPFLF